MFPLPARPSGPPARAPFWRSSRRTAALALALLLALLAAGEGAAQDGAAPEEVLPPATDLRLEPAEVRRRLSHHLLRAGYRDVTQDEERARLRAWLPAREEELRSAIRNAHYTLVECALHAPETVEGSVRPGQLTIQDTRARFDPATHGARLSRGAKWFALLRTAPPWDLLSNPWIVWHAFDGRRVLEAQYPNTLYRTIVGEDLVEYLTEWGGWWPERADSGDGGFTTFLQGTDALPADLYDERALAALREEAAAAGAPADYAPTSLHPIHPFYREPGGAGPIPSILTMVVTWDRRGPSEPDMAHDWWVSEEEILWSSIAWAVGTDVPSIAVLVASFDRRSGLTKGMALVSLEAATGAWTGRRQQFDLAVVTTAEGEPLTVPVAWSRVQVVPDWLAEALELRPEDAAPPPPFEEEVKAVLYRTLNDPSLDDPVGYEFPAFAEEQGVRFHPLVWKSFSRPGRSREPAEEAAWGLGAPVIGPARNAPDLFARWDAFVAATLASVEVPIPAGDVIPYEEHLRAHLRAPVPHPPTGVPELDAERPWWVWQYQTIPRAEWDAAQR